LNECMKCEEFGISFYSEMRRKIKKGSLLYGF
jgi:hypothetical protein